MKHLLISGWIDLLIEGESDVIDAIPRRKLE